MTLKNPTIPFSSYDLTHAGSLGNLLEPCDRRDLLVMTVLQISAASFSTDWEDYRDQEVRKGPFFMKGRSGVECYREWCLCFHFKWDKMLFLFLCKKKFRNQVYRRSLQSHGSLSQLSSCLPRTQSPSSYNVLFPTPLHWLMITHRNYFSSLGRQKTNLFKNMSNVTKTVLDQSKHIFKSGFVTRSGQ